MLKRLLAAALALFTFAVFAAVDVNKANQADLESIKGIGPMIATKILDERKKGAFKDWQDMVDRVKGIGENNAARFSTDGLTVNGAAFAGAPAAASKSGTPMKTGTTAKAPDTGVMAKPSATAPAASSATMTKTKAEERAEKKAARDEAKAAKAETKSDAKAMKTDAKAAPMAAKTDTKAAPMAAASAPSATKTAASAPAAKK